MVDPGFPRCLCVCVCEGEGRQPQRRQRKPIIWQDFCQNLNENERNWTLGSVNENCTFARKKHMKLRFTNHLR